MKRAAPQPVLAIALVTSLFLAGCATGDPSGNDAAAPNPAAANAAASASNSLAATATSALPVALPTQEAGAGFDAGNPSTEDIINGLPSNTVVLNSPIPQGADMATDAPRTEAPVTPAPPRNGEVNVEIDRMAPHAVPERDTGDEDPGSGDKEIDKARNGSGNLVTLDEAAALACAAAEGALTDLDEGRPAVDRLIVLHEWAEETAKSAISDGAELVGSGGDIAEIVGFLTICVDGGYEL
jgi:hypothetical protein